MENANVKQSVQNRELLSKEYVQLKSLCKKYLTGVELVDLEIAFNEAHKQYKIHFSEQRESEMVIPIQLAQIAAEYIEVDIHTLTAIFFYFLVRNKYVEEIFIEKKFGKSTINIIRGVQKLETFDLHKFSTKFESLHEIKDSQNSFVKSLHSENYRKLLLSLANDPRVILVRLSYRLLLMRNVRSASPEVRAEMGRETFLAHVSIAHQLGLYKLKTELEELSMEYSHNNEYTTIKNALKNTRQEQEHIIRDFISPLKDELAKNNIDCTIKGRPKSVFSIWNKMVKQDVSIDKVYDLLAIRIIVKNVIREEESSACWKVYSIVTNSYKPNPKRLRDWISNPRPSGYESLHTTVDLADGKTIEVQIRTERMDEIAENGLAAHWKYKQVSSAKSSGEWVNKIRDLLESKNIERSVYENSNFNEQIEEIFVFSPANELIKLRKGSTVLDFAYLIHTKIGNTCNGAVINGKNVSIKQVLENADQVKILTSVSQKPNVNWLNYVISPRSKAKIKKELKRLNFFAAEDGIEIITRKLNQLKLPYNSENLQKILEYFELSEMHEMLHLVGLGKIDDSRIRKVFETQVETEKPAAKESEKKKPPVVVSNIQDYLIIDEKFNTSNYSLAKCCMPAKGDEIFGFITVSNGTRIHKTNCPNAAQMRKNYSYRIKEARWNN